MATTKPGISGKRVVTILVVVLVLIGGWLSYSLWTYSQLDQARKATESAWRVVAQRLSDRYREVELVLARGVDDRHIEMELGERFRLTLDRFLTTAQPTGKVGAARELEDQLSGLDDLPVPSAQLQSAIEQFNACLDKEREVLASPGGRFLSIFLKFAEPTELTLAN